MASFGKIIHAYNLLIWKVIETNNLLMLHTYQRLQTKNLNIIIHSEKKNFWKKHTLSKTAISVHSSNSWLCSKGMVSVKKLMEFLVWLRKKVWRTKKKIMFGLFIRTVLFQNPFCLSVWLQATWKIHHMLFLEGSIHLKFF